LEELLLGEVGNPPDPTPPPISERMKFQPHDHQPQMAIAAYEPKPLPTPKNAHNDDHVNFRGPGEVIERVVELPYS